MPRTRIEKCHCGKPLHYNSEEVKHMVEATIKQLGPNQRIMVGGRTWLVPRHYIALHGIKGAKMETYGFVEVLDAPVAGPAKAGRPRRP